MLPITNMHNLLVTKQLPLDASTKEEQTRYVWKKSQC